MASVLDLIPSDPNDPRYYKLGDAPNQTQGGMPVSVVPNYYSLNAGVPQLFDNMQSGNQAQRMDGLSLGYDGTIGRTSYNLSADLDNQARLRGLSADARFPIGDGALSLGAGLSRYDGRNMLDQVRAAYELPMGNGQVSVSAQGAPSGLNNVGLGYNSENGSFGVDYNPQRKGLNVRARIPFRKD